VLFDPALQRFQRGIDIERQWRFHLVGQARFGRVERCGHGENQLAVLARIDAARCKAAAFGQRGHGIVRRVGSNSGFQEMGVERMGKFAALLFS